MEEVLSVEIPYAPREQFMGFHDRTERWGIVVAHRRAGKTVACVNELIKAAVTCEKSDARFGYIAPLHAQAKDIAWDYLVRYSAPIPDLNINISELRIDYPNGARVRLYGAENAERMRGLYFDGVVIDEPADIDPRVWPEIVRPALADRQGWAVWIGTPKGKNAFWDLWEKAQRESDWFSLMLKASLTGLVAPQELEAARREMTEDQYDQEFECSFEAAIQGAYYGKEMKQADADTRITRVPYEAGAVVHTAWDLGIDDSTAIWFAQLVGKEVRIIDYYENQGHDLAHYVSHLRSKPYGYAPEHILPHDANVRELGTGKSRVEMLQSLGLKCRVLPVQEVADGINAVRMLLPRVWFDRDKCSRGIEALRQYRTDYDEKLKVFKNRPLHDWTSHAADAFRYLALGLKPAMPKPTQKQNVKWVV